MDQLRSPSWRVSSRDMTPDPYTTCTCVLSIEVMIRKSQPCKRPVEELGLCLSSSHEGASSVDFLEIHPCIYLLFHLSANIYKLMGRPQKSTTTQPSLQGTFLGPWWMTVTHTVSWIHSVDPTFQRPLSAMI